MTGTVLKYRVGLVYLLLTFACGSDPFAPTDFAGSYELRQMNGSALPFDHSGLGCCTYLSGGLELQSAHYAISITARNRNSGTVFTATEWGTYVVDTEKLVFEPDSVLVAPFLLDTAMVSGDTIRVSFGGEGPGSPDQFDALLVKGN